MMTAANSLSTSRIFVSYRRDDAAWPAGRLFDRLVDHFGADQVFRDVEAIRLGDDFVIEITAAVESCTALLPVIGAQWLTVTGEGGQRRLDDPADFVRLEIEAAFARGVWVIPVLVDGAQMPHATELPDSLAELAHKQALELSPSRFGPDTERLLAELDRKLGRMAIGPAGPPASTSRPLGRSAGLGEVQAERRRPAHRNVAGYWRFWIGLLLIAGGSVCLLEKVPHKVGYSTRFWSVQHADTYTQVALITLIILGTLLLAGAVFSAISAASAPRGQR